LFGDLNLDTGALSGRIERGKHTTRTVEFFKNNLGGYAADTPGFSALDFENNYYMPKENLIFAFPEMEKYAGNCKYTKCTHVKEDGCGVVESVNSGEITKSRHESYTDIFEILKNQKNYNKSGK